MKPFAFVLLIPVLVAVVCDLRRREVPDWIPLVILAGACVATATGLNEVTWKALLLGALLGFVLPGIVYCLGGLGGGDVTLLTAIGAAVGPGALLEILAWMAFAGGILALVALARGKREIAYVPASAFGLLIEAVWPGGLAHVLLC